MPLVDGVPTATPVIYVPGGTDCHRPDALIEFSSSDVGDGLNRIIPPVKHGGSGHEDGGGVCACHVHLFLPTRS